MRKPVRSSLTLVAVLTGLVGAHAAEPGPAPLYDPTQLPALHGRLQLFTLTPRGDISGFVLEDGTEVKTPPHLTAELAGIVRPGDRVTVHGLRAASLPLVQAMSVGNDATGAVVVDAGPPGRVPPPQSRDDLAPIAIRGPIRMLLHGPRGDVNGALLEDGTVLALPPPDAARFAGLLVPGTVVSAEGIRHTLPVGTFVALTALGPESGPLVPVAASPRFAPGPPGPPPG